LDYHELRVVIGPNGAGRHAARRGLGQGAAGRRRVIFGKHTELVGSGERDRGPGHRAQVPDAVIFANLSVRENLELSLARPSKGPGDLRARLDGVQRARVEETLETIGWAAAGAERAAGSARREAVARSRQWSSVQQPSSCWWTSPWPG